ncbi:MAG TPA: S41 family peptidase [bacterium]|nr:S41 family peptidase [bacterium]
MSIFKKQISLYLVLILMILAFLGGLIIGSNNFTVDNNTNTDKISGQVLDKDKLPDYLTKDVNFNLFWEVWQKIQASYIDRPVSETKLLYGAMSGLVGSLGDPYSLFFEPVEAKKFTDDLKGKFEGIGAEIGLRDGIITIIAPLPGTPAELAGLKAGDKVIEIDGASTEKMDLDAAVNKIRGKKGTAVKLKIYRPKDNNYKENDIIRDEIKILSVKMEMKENNIAYIQITNFNEDTEELFQKAVNEILIKNPRGIILDLRNNPGGYLDRSIEIASYWLSPGQIVVKEELNGGEKIQHLANGLAQLRTIKTVVLINGGSASASEIVSGALQDFDLAELVGEKTFGKGSVQALEDLSDGSSVKLTVARWLTPKDRQINVVGIEPDIKVELTEDDFNAGKDPQLDKAIEMLTQ